MPGSLLMRPILHSYYDPFIVDEMLPGHSWNIYPNPVSNGVLHIENSMATAIDLQKTSTSISIYDILGRSLISIPYSNVINTASLPQGFYIVHISNEEGSINHIHKIIIKNEIIMTGETICRIDIPQARIAVISESADRRPKTSMTATSTAHGIVKVRAIGIRQSANSNMLDIGSP